MTGWSGGYVADVEYISGFYRQQGPAHMALAALLGGVDARLPKGDDAAHYMELGCGRGMNAILVAASNPGWRVTAVDYNPAHIAHGTALAHEAGLTNIDFLEADFSHLADHPPELPVDLVSMHGVWSWVSASVRAAIVRLLGRVVAPGGLVHLSYNALPAWQGGLGLQRLVYEAGRRAAGRSDKQALAGLAFATDLHKAAAYNLATDMAGGLLPRMTEAPVHYLAHEYMNADWSPCFHADVAAALSEAKLDWAGSANLLESFPDLMMTPAQRAQLERFDDPIFRELVKDCCLSRQLRHDVFVRGARRLTADERDRHLMDLTLGLSLPAGLFDYTVDVPAGQAEMGPAFRPMVAVLQDGPAAIRRVLAGVAGESNPAEVAAVLVATNQGFILPNPGAARAPGADRLNRVLGRKVTTLAGPEPSGGVACAALGTGLPAGRLLQFMVARLLEGEDTGSLDRWHGTLAATLPDELHDGLRALMHKIVEEQLPILRTVGVVG